MAEFHISRKIRRRYGMDDALFQTDGNLILANFKASRDFAQKINTRHDPEFPSDGIRPGEIHAVGLMDEIFHYVISLYQNQNNPLFFQGLLRQMEKEHSADTLDSFLTAFVHEFPPTSVFKKQATPRDYLQKETAGISNREIVLEELIIIWMANQNRAYKPLIALFDDQEIQKLDEYARIIDVIDAYSKSQPGFGPRTDDLVQFLRSPALAVPDSIPGQLEYIRREWGYLLGDFLLRILGSLDLLKEETRQALMGPGPVQIPLYDAAQEGMLEKERYSRDSDWMPNLVLIARNSYVWLHQLSGQYQRTIRYLSDIPDKELELLSRRGINGLWLIGLWERSRASARIKQLC